MTIDQVFDIIKDVTPGRWKIGITYSKPLPILKGRGKGPSPAEQAGIFAGDLTKEVFRWCSARVNPASTKSAEAARQAKADKIANGEEVRERPSGFHATTEADEENLIQYRDGTNEPCLILKKSPNPDKVKYFLKGQEISREDVEELIANKIVSKTALNELAPNEIFFMYPDKVKSIKLDGVLHENMENLKEAAITFNGKEYPNEDGFYDMEEELCEGSRGKYVQTQFDLAKKASDKAARLANQGASATTSNAANTYYKAADKAAGDAFKRNDKLRDYRTRQDDAWDFYHTNDHKYHGSNSIRDLSMDKKNANNFKADFYSHDEDKLAKRKPGNLVNNSAKFTEAAKCQKVIACYNDDDGYDQAAWFAVPVGKTLEELEDFIYDHGMMYVDVREETLRPSKNNYTDFDWIEEGDPNPNVKDFGYDGEEIYEELKRNKHSRKITESMNHEARKYGYKNYQEYLNSNK